MTAGTIGAYGMDVFAIRSALLKNRPSNKPDDLSNFYASNFRLPKADQ